MYYIYTEILTYTPTQPHIKFTVYYSCHLVLSSDHKSYQQYFDIY